MSTTIDIAARIIAHTARHAFAIRTTSTLSADPPRTFGLVILKVVSEEQVQALAYGDITEPPHIITRVRPLGRESADLEPFARALDEYLTAMLGAGALPRVWLPHAAALALVDLLGHRYRTNTRASDTLRRMGWLCRGLTEEARYAGQQVIAVATDLLTWHVVTGQAPLKDRHLGALLAWVDPPTGTDPTIEADRRALIPAAGMLPRDEDDRLEALRKRAKRGDATARREIETILAAAARREWALLVEARRAFWGLHLPPAPGLDRLRAESLSRMGTPRDRGPASQAHALAALLDEHEYAVTMSEDVDVRADERIRERARRAGRAIRFEVVDVIQTQQNRHPCTLVLRTTQDVLRLRHGTQLSLVNRSIDGRVLDIRSEEVPVPATVLHVRVVRGVRSVPARGTHVDWVDSVPFDGRYLKSRVYQAVAATRPALVYDDRLPAPGPRRIPARDLGRVAEQSRRR